MNEQTPEVRCGSCKSLINEASDTPAEKRSPCPKCGATIRHIKVSVADTLHLHENLSYKAKRQGHGRPFLEGKTGDDLHHKTGKWMKLERIIDRAKDRYKELVTDPETGNVLHHCEEPLSGHQGHGTDKSRSEKRK